MILFDVMATGIAKTSSVALTNLRDELLRLSGTLLDTYDILDTDMTQLGDEWRDDKYKEFIDEYQPQIKKCEEISIRYKEWCEEKINPIIETVEELEIQDVTLFDNSVGQEVSKFVGQGVFFATQAIKKGGEWLDRMTSSLRTEEKEIITDPIEKNNKDIEKARGKPRGKPMTIEKAADANPNYWISAQHRVNCATCAAAFALRLRGHDVEAKGNPKRIGNLNYWLSQGNNSFEIWNNADGTKAKPTLYTDYMNKNGLKKMSAKDYESFYGAACKEKGVYVATFRWKPTTEKKEPGAHAVILLRDDKGLHYIDPQIYYNSTIYDNSTINRRRNINDMIRRFNSDPAGGVMRVDDKLFNTKYIGLFKNTHWAN